MLGFKMYPFCMENAPTTKTPPYMPFYVGDYLADTTHLEALEHGAYLLLLMAMWRSGGKLPNDDARLIKLARMRPEQWAKVRDTVLAFFQCNDGVLSHKRLDREYAKYNDTVAKRSKAGKASARKKSSKNKNDDATHVGNVLQHNPTNQNQNQNQNHNQKDLEGGGGGGAPSPPGWPVDRKDWVPALIKATGCADPVRDTWPVTSLAVLTGWHDVDRFAWSDVTGAIIAALPTIKPDDPPKSWRYFSAAIARFRADQTVSAPKVPEYDRNIPRHWPGKAPDHNTRTPDRRTAAQRNQDSTIAAFARVFGRPQNGPDVAVVPDGSG